LFKSAFINISARFANPSQRAAGHSPRGTMHAQIGNAIDHKAARNAGPNCDVEKNPIGFPCPKKCFSQRPRSDIGLERDRSKVCKLPLYLSGFPIQQVVAEDFASASNQFANAKPYCRKCGAFQSIIDGEFVRSTERSAPVGISFSTSTSPAGKRTTPNAVFVPPTSIPMAINVALPIGSSSFAEPVGQCPNVGRITTAASAQVTNTFGACRSRKIREFSARHLDGLQLIRERRVTCKRVAILGAAECGWLSRKGHLDGGAHFAQ